MVEEEVEISFGESYFPYTFLNEIQTIFSHQAKRSARVLPADLCTDHAHHFKITDQRFSRRNKNLAIQAGLFLTIIFL